MEASVPKRLKELEEDKQGLKWVYADSSHEHRALWDIVLDKAGTHSKRCKQTVWGLREYGLNEYPTYNILNFIRSVFL
jgi:hypothetical protein